MTCKLKLKCFQNVILGKHNSVASIFHLQFFLNKTLRNCHLNFSLHVLKYFRVQTEVKVKPSHVLRLTKLS